MCDFGRVGANQFNFKADPLALTALSTELGPQLAKYTVSRDGGLQVRDRHSRCHLRPP
jgi:hypothetical protein